MIEIKPEEIPGEIRLLRMKKDDVHLGDLLVSVYDHKKIEVLFIFIYKKYRHNGYGRLFITHLKRNFDHIVTSWNDSSTEGKNLFTNMGFKIIVPMFKNQIKTLEWKKSKEVVIPSMDLPICKHDDSHITVLLGKMEFVRNRCGIKFIGTVEYGSCKICNRVMDNMRESWIDNYLRVL